MANSSTNENILVKMDQNNLVYIDPSSVVTKDGEVLSRLVDHENLVTYVNLEADLIPRTVLYSDGNKNTLLSIASGKLNLMSNTAGENYNKNNNSQGFNNNFDFDTTWTDSFFTNTSENGKTAIRNDATAQTFGIDSISLVTKGANAIPEATINFIDVRGKTLFESPKDSPYQAFFHQPWPIFYLTIKGYYGKAIRYRLHMVDFKSRFGANGNFEITTKFVGSTFAYLSDILLQNILTAPYMYMDETSGDYSYNTKTNLIDKEIKKSTKGFSILKSVYKSYKEKKLIPKNFPDKTLKDLIMTAQSAERLLESQIFENVVDFKILAAVKEYEQSVITPLINAVNSWGSNYLDLKNPETPEDANVPYYKLTRAAGEDIPTLASVTGVSQQALYYIVKIKRDAAYQNEAFGVNANQVDSKKNNQNVDKDRIKLKTISFEEVIVNDKFLNSKYYSQKGGYVSVALDLLISDITKISNEFVAQRNDLENKIEQKMNTILETDQNLGIGFKPTIRNIFAVILANADTYIRLMKDVHFKAVQSAKERQKVLNARSLTDGPSEGIYPWPQVKKQINNNTLTLMYPGDKDIAGSIKANDPNIWPEVEFLELYEGFATKRTDPLTGNEIDISKLNYIFPKDSEERIVRDVSSAVWLTDKSPYVDKSVSTLIYEIWERAFYITSFDSFSNEVIKELSKNEFDTINDSTENDDDIRDLLKNQLRARYVQSGLTAYEDLLLNFSPYERYPYHVEKLPTVDYLKTINDYDFSIEEFSLQKITAFKQGTYDELKKEIGEFKYGKLYTPLDYRYNIYPFNSSLYKNYINKELKREDFDFSDVLTVNSNNSFLSSPISPESWVKKDFTNNLFNQKILLTGTTRNILNTPYFHKQLYSDFFKGGVDNRFVGSAYLLLNSLPFRDLDDTLEFSNESKILMSSLFREIGASHFIPYHLVLKWGSQYHRYKKYLLEGEDIISGVTTAIDSGMFFDMDSGVTFTYDNNTTYVSGTTIYTTGTTLATPTKTVGIYPWYQNVYHQVVNNYLFYSPGVLSGSENVGDITLSGATMAINFATASSNGTINTKTSSPYMSKGLMLSLLVDNSKFVTGDTRYTLLPSFGSSKLKDLDNEYQTIEQDSFKIIWSEEEEIYPNYSGLTIPSYKENFKNVVTGDYSIYNNNRKIIDLIAIFNPKILDDFEKMFLDFSSLTLNMSGNSTTNTFKYNTFQGLLKEISSVSKSKVTLDKIDTIITEQKSNLETITKDILKNENLVKLTLGNPKQIDNNVLYGVTGLLSNSKYYDGDFDSAQLTSQNLKLIELYIGEDISGYYSDYFELMNIEVSEENIIANRELARIYGGYASVYTANTSSSQFITYLKDNIITKQEARFKTFLDDLILNKIQGLTVNQGKAVTVLNGFNTDKTTKLETYNFFKEFNDKWIGGNSLGQRLLLEEFLFLDRANRDIGDELFLSLDRLIPLADQRNTKASLYSIISMLIQGNSIDFRPLPAYVNFYGTNFGDKKKITPSKDLARHLFGTYLDVDYQEASPKMVLQYMGPQSKYLSMKEVSPNNKFKNDALDIRNTTKNALLVPQNLFVATDFTRSNRVVGFEVNFGDQAQGLFKGVSLDQNTKVPTSESFLAYENLGRSSSGSNTYQVDVNLFDLYRTYSYTCEVSALGNVMIQPTMYFYLNNVPMFEGTYFITEVAHTIKNNQVETTFKGARIPVDNLPDVKESFVAAYRPLFDKILGAAIAKKQTANSTTTTAKTVLINNNNVDYDMGANTVAGEAILPESGHLGGVPYNGTNGEKYIQYVSYNGEKWLRGVVVKMTESENFPISDDATMTVITRKLNTTKNVTYSNVKGTLAKYFSTRFDFNNTSAETIFDKPMVFYNPNRAKNDSTGNKNPFVLSPTTNTNNNIYEGPIHNGLPEKNFGIAMSDSLMRYMGVNTGDVIYFKPEGA